MVKTRFQLLNDVNKIDCGQSYGGFVFCLSFVCCFACFVPLPVFRLTWGDGWIGRRCINGRPASSPPVLEPDLVLVGSPESCTGAGTRGAVLCNRPCPYAKSPSLFSCKWEKNIAASQAHHHRMLLLVLEFTACVFYLISDWLKGIIGTFSKHSKSK